MKLYAFSDFHLSGDPPTKPMDIFGDNWKNHREKIIESWTNTIQPEDGHYGRRPFLVHPSSRCTK